MAYSLNGFIISESLKTNMANLASQIALKKHILEIIPPEYFRGGTDELLPRWIGTIPSIYAYQVEGIGYFSAMLHYFFGFKPILAIFFNSLLGSTLGICVYSIAKEISNNDNISRLSAILTNFLPSLFLWSIINQKDIAYIFINTLIVLCMIKIAKGKKLFFIFYIVLLSLFQLYLRPRFISLLLMYYILIFLFILWSWIPTKKIVSILLVFLAIFSMLFPQTRNFIEKVSYKSITKTYNLILDTLVHHKSQVLEGASNYKILQEQRYSTVDPTAKVSLEGMSFKEIFMAYLLGLDNFVFQPFPLKINSFLKLLSYPQEILIYFLLAFFLLGLFIILRQNALLFNILFFYIFIFSLIVILGEGNVGGLFRHRDIVTPIFIIFAVTGFSVFFKTNKSRYEL